MILTAALHRRDVVVVVAASAGKMVRCREKGVVGAQVEWKGDDII